MELSQGPFAQIFCYVTPSRSVCPVHYCVTSILKIGQVLSMGSSHVLLFCTVGSQHQLVLDVFHGLQLASRRCAHDLSGCFFLNVSMEQWSCAVEGSQCVICFQAFVFPFYLDVTSDGGGIIPTPECRGATDGD